MEEVELPLLRFPYLSPPTSPDPSPLISIANPSQHSRSWAAIYTALALLLFVPALLRLRSFHLALLSESLPSDSLLANVAMESSESTTQAKSNNPGSGTSSLASAMTSAPQRSNSQTSLHKAGHIATHRQSFAENQRHPPPSPRAQSHPSFTQQAIQDLLNHPPNSRQANPRFAGRDWRDICLGELISQDDVKWAELDSSVEEATMVSTFSSTSALLVDPYDLMLT